MFSVVLFAGILAAGLPIRDRHIETPNVAPPCIRGVSGDCSPSYWERSSQPQPPVRECPEGSSMATVRPGVRYCIPDRPIGE